MRVCFISHSSGKYGAEKALIELIDGLTERDVKCYVLVPKQGPLIEELRKRSIPYYVVPFRWWAGKEVPAWRRIARNVLNLLILIVVVWQLIKWRCHLVYTNTMTVYIGAVAASVTRRPHVWHVHELGYENHGFTFDFGVKFSMWLMSRLSKFVITNSKAVEKKYSQYVPKEKLKMVYHSVDVPDRVGRNSIDLSASQEDIMKCIIVGRLQEGKGQEDAIRATQVLAQEGIKCQLFIVGGGDPAYRQHLMDVASECGVEDHVHFTGHVDNPFPLMEAADIVLMCSIHEAFGRVTVEAMKLGKPVIGAMSGGTIELIRDGFNGLLYPPKDYKALAEKIRYLYEHPAKAQRMGENGRQWASEQFTQDRYSEEVHAILTQLVGS